MMTREQIIERFGKNSIAMAVGLLPYGILRCLDEWERPHRFYHGMNHLSDLLEEIKDLTMPIVWSKDSIEKMELLALWHDVVYDPRKLNNEDASIEFVKYQHIISEGKNPCMDALREIFEGIRYTKYDKKNSFTNLGSNNFISMFCHLDIGRYEMVYEGETPTGLRNKEIALLKEYQHLNFPAYRKGRIDFLEKFPYFSTPESEKAVDFIKNYRPKIGVYPGSFSPFHIGHINILEQAEKIFDKVIIAVGSNPLKDKHAFGQPSVELVLPFHQVVRYDSLLSDYLKTIDYADVTVIRGLRSGYDLDYEMNQLRVLEDYGCKLPVAYFLCSKETTHVSSSMIRGLFKFKNNDVEKYIPQKYSYANG